VAEHEIVRLGRRCQGAEADRCVDASEPTRSIDGVNLIESTKIDDDRFGGWELRAGQSGPTTERDDWKTGIGDQPQASRDLRPIAWYDREPRSASVSFGGIGEAPRSPSVEPEPRRLLDHVRRTDQAGQRPAQALLGVRH
jgi:hypothetical protein